MFGKVQRNTFGGTALVILFLVSFLLKPHILQVNTTTTSVLRKFSSLAKLNFAIESSPAASRLPKSGKLFCYVITAEKYYGTRVPAVNQTWLKRCDHGEFFVKRPLNDTSIPFSTAFQDLDDDYEHLFQKSLRAMFFAYTSVSADFDWYFKVDDDSYVIVEHLNEFLKQFDHREPHYLGYQWVIKEGVYHSGGPGYALSNAAMKLFLEKAYQDRRICPFNKNEDIGIAHCLKNIGIKTTVTPQSQQLFLPLRGIPSRLNPNVISLHYQSPADMLLLENLLYNVKSPQRSDFFKY